MPAIQFSTLFVVLRSSGDRGMYSSISSMVVNGMKQGSIYSKIDPCGTHEQTFVLADLIQPTETVLLSLKYDMYQMRERSDRPTDF